jgi:hypothetical protein
MRRLREPEPTLTTFDANSTPMVCDDRTRPMNSVFAQDMVVVTYTRFSRNGARYKIYRD